MPETLIFIGTPDRNRTCSPVYQRDSAGLKRPFYGDRYSSNPPQNCKSGAKVAQTLAPTSHPLTATVTLTGEQHG